MAYEFWMVGWFGFYVTFNTAYIIFGVSIKVIFILAFHFNHYKTVTLKSQALETIADPQLFYMYLAIFPFAVGQFHV